jgi:hypothetical protein
VVVFLRIDHYMTKLFVTQTGLILVGLFGPDFVSRERPDPVRDYLEDCVLHRPDKGLENERSHHTASQLEPCRAYAS